MALVLADRVKETTTTTGTGTVTLAGAATGFQSFAVVGNGNTTYYTIAGQGTAEWEVGIGTYTSVGTTLSRTTVLASSNAGSLVVFSAGTKDVFVTYPAGRSIYADGTTLTATNSSVLPATSGGTGQSSYAVGDLVYASTTTALSKLADVATGNAIISGGVGVAPSYGKIGLTTHISGTLAVGNGGTGLTTYAVGDIPYASATTTISSLADVATGNAIISGGVGVAPSYGKIGLTTHVSGTLPIANGGTNSTATATAGGVSYGTGTAFAFTSAGTAGQVLTSAAAAVPTWTTATSANTASAIVQRDASGNFTAGTITAALTGNVSGSSGSTTGNAATATTLQTARTIAITGDLAYTSPSFDGSANVTAAGTLATVNSNVGSFTAANITVNAKGLITAASSGTAGASISNDTSTSTNLYPLFAAATSGTPTTIYTGNANLLYKPSSGELQSTVLVAGNGIVVNSQTVAASYTIPTGSSGMSSGPITIASGQTVTIASGSQWAVL